MFDTYHLTRKNAIYHFVIFTDVCGEDRTSPAGDTGNLRCPLGLPPREGKSMALRATTASPRPAKGDPW